MVSQSVYPVQDGRVYRAGDSGPWAILTDSAAAMEIRRSTSTFIQEGRALLRMAVPADWNDAITSATLRLSFASGSGDPDITVQALAVDGPLTVDMADAPAVGPAITTEVALSSSSVRTVELDIRPLVQAVVNRAGWTAGGTVILRVTSAATFPAAFYPVERQFDYQRPYLTVEWTPRPLQPSFLATIGELTATVTDTSTGGYGQFTRRWDFGDGTVVEAGPATMSHTYATGGSYPVMLTVADEGGQSATTTRMVVVNRAPAVVFTVAVDGPTVSVDARASYDPDGDDIVRAVDFGDDTATVTGDLVNHTYQTPGTYTITVTVRDAKGATASGTTQVTIVDQLLASMDFAPAGLTVRFTDTSRPKAGIPIVSRTWDFGDGTLDTGGGPSVTHTYPGPGLYTAALTVRDSAGTTRTATATVETTAVVRMVAGDPTGLWETARTARVRETSAMVEVIAPDGEILAILGGPEATHRGVVSGEVVSDGDRVPTWSCTLTVNDAALLPRRARDLLHPLSHNRLRAWWLLRLPDGTWGAQCVGTFYPKAPQISDNGIVSFTVKCEDVSARVSRAVWDNTSPKVAGLPNHEAVEAIWSSRVPKAPRTVTTSEHVLPEDYQLGAPGDDPNDDVDAIAKAAGMVARTDRYGTLTLAPTPQVSEPVRHYAEGPGCTVTELQRDLSMDDVANRVVVYSTSSEIDPPVYGAAVVVDDAQGLSIANSWLFTKVIDSPEVTTRAQATAMAQAELVKYQALTEQVEIVHRADPGLNPGDTIRLERAASGVTGLFQVQSWSLALGPNSGQRTVLASRKVTA